MNKYVRAWFLRAVALLISAAVPMIAILTVTQPTVQTDVTLTVVLIVVMSVVAFVVTGIIFTFAANIMLEGDMVQTVVKHVHVPGPEVIKEVPVAVTSSSAHQSSGWELVAAFTAGGIIGFVTFVYWRVRRWWRKI